MNQIKKYLCLIIFLILLVRQTNQQKHTSLQLQNYDINLKRSASKNYTISIKLTYQSDEIKQTIFCFKQMVTVPDKSNENCNLVQKSQLYNCVEISYLRVIVVLVSDVKFFTFSVSKGITQISSTTYPVNVNLQNVTRSISVADMLDDYKIYHMISATSRDILTTYESDNSQAKQSYVHTYAIATYFDTLIVQRYYHCIIHQNKTVYIFEGAASRGSLPHFFTAILTISNTNTPFHMWGGYSYSSGHAARDMVGYESNTGSFYDMFSLYASAPFQDIATNIKGQKNVVRIGNSGKTSSIQSIPYHFIQFYRLFDTQDTKGDQIIQNKIYNKFCFAAYFQNYTAGVDSSLSVMSNSFKHELIDCHLPVLTIYQKLINSKILITLMIILVMLI